MVRGARPFDSLIKKSTNGCWHWIGYVDKNGYPIATVNRLPVLAHRLAFERHHGVRLAPRGTPEHRQVDHACHNRSRSCPGGTSCLHRRCVNPAHLELTTPAENTERSSRTAAHKNRRKTHCGVCGNDLNGPDVYHYGGGRKCKPCAVRRRNESRWRRRAA